MKGWQLVEKRKSDSVVVWKIGMKHIVLGLFRQVSGRRRNTASPPPQGELTFFLLFDTMFNKIMLRMKCLKQKENVLANSSYKQQCFASCSIISLVIV